MIIGLPANGEDSSSPIAKTFEYCLYYVVTDLDKQKIVTPLLNYIQSATRIAAIQVAQLLIDHQVKVIITPKISSNTSNILQKIGIRIYMAVEGSIEKNISLFRQGRLDEIKNS
ncbi:MAG: NifB/NifX family molybdenum-iron cluster-binding protein [Candidatus Hodarchaeota archaeon]